MANVIKYGKYWIAAGIAVTGVLWFNRPGDRRILGEDVADLFEAVQERAVVAYLTGTAQPNWEADVNHRTNSIDSFIRYFDILDISARSRQLWTQSGNILWTTNVITGDTYEPAKRNGAYNTWTNRGVLVDEYNGTGGWYITNRVYSFQEHTNTFTDIMTTSATRLFSNSVPWTILDGYGNADPLSSTNTPVSGNVFDYATSTTLQGQTTYNAWPFATAYQYPWEQWSYPQHSRITAIAVSGDNMAWTNVCWAGINNLTFTMDAPITTNITGYCISKFSNIYGNTSSNFVYIKDAPESNGLYLQSAYGPSVTFGIGTFPQVIVIAEGKARYKYIRPSTVQGDTITLYGGGRIYGWGWAIQWVNQYSEKNAIIKIEAFDDVGCTTLSTNIAPIYFNLRITDTPFCGTNSFFNIPAPAFNASSVTAIATTNSIVSGLYATDDKRISTNKLNGLAQIITNLNRTVYFGDYQALTATRIVNYYESTDVLTNFVNESDTGSALPVTYYDFGNPNQYITPWVNTLQPTWPFAYTNLSHIRDLYNIHISYEAQKIGGVLSDSSWTSYTAILGKLCHEDKYTHKDITPVYPSLYALTNGYVKSIKIYVLAQNYVNDQSGYYNGVYGGETSHSVTGNYWTTKNCGIVVSNINLNIPTMAVDDTRVKGLYRNYDNLFANTAIYSKIFETNNPTGPISFDLSPSVVRPDLSARHAYTYATDNGRFPYYTDSYFWDFTVELGVEITKVMIVVDWNWQHLGNGFTPVTNNPAWRQ